MSTDTLKDIMKRGMTGVATKEELAKAFASLLKKMQEFLAELEDTKKKAEASTRHSSVVLNKSRLLNRKTEKNLSNKLSEAQNALSKDINRVEALIPPEQDLTPLQSDIQKLGIMLEEVRSVAGETLSAVEIRNLLEDLEGNERLRIEAIDGLEDKIKKLEQFRGGGNILGGFGVRKVRVPMVDDFSDQTDGSTKTFVLSKAPSEKNTMKIWGSDFPYILRVNTDFTVSKKLLTLTSEVDAPSNGATLIAEYYV